MIEYYAEKHFQTMVIPVFMHLWSDWERLGAISGSIIISYPFFDHDLVVHQAMIAIDFGYLMHFER